MVYGPRVIDAILSLKDNFTAKLEHINKSMRVFERQSKYMGKNIRGVGRQFTQAGKTMTAGITLPVIGIGAASAKAAIDFESAFAGVKKTVDGTTEDFIQLRKEILSLSEKMPQSASEISKVAEAAGQLGIKKEAILDFTKTIVMVGDTTNLVAEEAATSFARFANITKMPQTEFDRLGSTVVALGNNLATTEQEITAMGLRLAGAGSQIGLAQSEIMGFSGALSSVGIEAEAGGSAFSKVMIDMQLAVQKGGKGLEKFAKVAGVSGKEFQRAFKQDAAGAIVSFIKGLSEAEKRGTTAIKMLDDMGIKEVRLRDTLLRAAGASDLFADSLKIANTAWDENTALQNEANQRYETTASKLSMLKNKFINLGIKIGEILLPTIQKIADKLGNLIDYFSNLNPKTQETIVKFALFAAALGPIILITGIIVNTIGNMVFNFGLLAGAIAKAGGVMAFLATPGMIVVGVVLAIVAAVALLIFNWDKVVAAFKKAGNAILNFCGISKGQLMEFFSWLGGIVGDIVGKVVEAFQGLVAKVGPSIQNFIDTVGQVFEQLKPILLPILAFIGGTFATGIMTAFSYVSTIVSNAIDTIGGVVSGLLDVLSGILSFLGNVFTGNWSAAWEDCQSIFSGVVGVIDSLWQGLVGFLTAPVQAVVEVLDSAFRSSVEWITNAWSNLKTFLAHPIRATVSLIKNGDLSGVDGKNALGTPYWGGGYSLVGEQGPEI
ncbi:MAG: phage tail tape measure protein, partial [Sarcina sp.]